MTLENPASLPPIEIEPYFVVALSEPNWLSSTSWVLAPEHAAKVKLEPSESLMRYG
jgi:hypothetical protein